MINPYFMPKNPFNDQTSPDTSPLNNIDLYPQAPQGPQPDAAALYGKYYQPQNTALNNYLNSAPPPDRSNFQPGALTRVGAVLAGLQNIKNGNSYQAGQQVLNSPYNDARQDYQDSQLQMFKRAQLEDAMNKSNQNDAIQMVGKILQERKAADTTQYYNNRIGVEQEKNKINLAANAIKQQLADNPNFTPVMAKGGNILLVDKKSGEIQDTGYTSGMLSDAAKASLGLTNKLSYFNQTEPIIQSDKQDNINLTQGAIDQRQQNSLANQNAPVTTTTDTAVDNSNPAAPTKKVTTTKSKATPSISSTTPNKQPARTRDDAVAYLTKNGKPVTDKNITYLLSNQDKW